MKITCPHPQCSSSSVSAPKRRSIVRNGYFRRRSDSRRVARFFCRSCKTYFSWASSKPEVYQKKRAVNVRLLRLYCSGVSQRRLARVLHLNRKTVVRKIRFLATQERLKHVRFLNACYGSKSLAEIQFDDLETSEHTKCKPLSVALAVDPRTRRILHYEVASMPAKGKLAEISRKKYGARPDERPQKWDSLMRNLVPLVKPDGSLVLRRKSSLPHTP